MNHRLHRGIARPGTPKRGGVRARRFPDVQGVHIDLGTESTPLNNTTSFPYAEFWHHLQVAYEHVVPSERFGLFASIRPI